MAVNHAIDENKTQVIQKKITESNGDQKKLFSIVNTLLGRRKQLVLPDYKNPTLIACFWWSAGGPPVAAPADR